VAAVKWQPTPVMAAKAAIHDLNGSFADIGPARLQTDVRRRMVPSEAPAVPALKNSSQKKRG